MAVPQSILHYGSFAAPLLTSEGYAINRDGLDVGRFTVVNNNSDSYPAGSAYNGFTILTDDVQRIGDVWEHNLNCVGIKGGKANRRLKYTTTNQLEGFDTATETWLANSPNPVSIGSRMSGFGNMVCESVSPEELEYGGWFRIQASYRGIINNKPVKRSISSNIDISVVDNLVLIGVDNRNPHKWAITFPKVTVTFSYVGNGTPLKNMPQQGGSPAGELPTIQTALTSLPTSDQLTWHWPSGWRLVSMPQEEIPGTTIRLTQEVWEWQQTVTP